MSDFWLSFWEGFLEGTGLRALRRYFTWRDVLNLAAWGLAAWLGYRVWWNGLVCNGEVTCDFAGQWLMGRMFVQGKGDQLYLPAAQRFEFASNYVKGPPDQVAALKRLARDEPERLRQVLSTAAPFTMLKHQCLVDPDLRRQLIGDAPMDDLQLDFTDSELMIAQIIRKHFPGTPTEPVPPRHELQPGAGLPYWGLPPPLPAELLDTVTSGDYLAWDPLIEGPLYPPTAGLIFLPFGFFEPKVAHAIADWFYSLSVLASGFFISRCCGRRIWWGEACALIVCFPNHLQTILLGQNSLLSLLILTAGWYAFTRKRPLVCGIIWGLLAYKPVFAVALLIVPLGLPNVRLLLGMVLGGGAMVLASLPFTGTAGLDRLVLRNDAVRWLRGQDEKNDPPSPLNIASVHPWERWLIVGKNAARIYNEDVNWIWMSRDLPCLVFRRMWTGPDWAEQSHYLYHRYIRGVDFFASHAHCTTEEYQLQTLQAVYKDDEHGTLARRGLILIGTMAACTVLLAWLGALARRRAGLGTDSTLELDRQAMLLAGALLSVLHYMHYDVLLYTLPCAISLSQLHRYGWLSRAWIVGVVLAMLFLYYDLWHPVGVVRFPFETVATLALWLGLAVRVWVQSLLAEAPPPPQPIVVVTLNPGGTPS